jgi:MFS family permease
MGFISSAGSLGRVLGPLISGALIVVNAPGAKGLDPTFGTKALFVAAGITLLSFLLLLAVPSDRTIQH